MRLAILFSEVSLLSCAVLLVCSSVLAQSWSGYLVDASCYQMRVQNNNPGNEDDAANRDHDLDVRLCVPDEKTKQFIFVDHDSLSFKLDDQGNAKARELLHNSVQSSKKKSDYIPVKITGQTQNGVLKVDSIAPDK
jgi:hypothetical protein